MPKVSVIIPIYGVEKFIGKCAESLMAQTLEDVEFIFVNDATKDGSMEVLAEVLRNHPERNVKILTHSENKGLPAARNTGLAEAKGEYIFHCDSDDFVEPEMLEEMVTCAERAGADYVWSDWFLTFAEKEKYMTQPSYSTSIEAMKGMLGGAMKYNVWNKLVKRSLYTDNGITFPEGHGMGEDMTMIMVMAVAGKIAYLPKAFYHYVKLNTGAFSQTKSEGNITALKSNVERLEAFLVSKFGHSLEKEIAFLKLEAKFPFLIMDGSRFYYKKWLSTFKEADEYIKYNNHISIRNRFVQLCAKKHQFWIVWLHYVLVSKIVYGILYK